MWKLIAFCFSVTWTAAYNLNDITGIDLEAAREKVGHTGEKIKLILTGIDGALIEPNNIVEKSFIPIDSANDLLERISTTPEIDLVFTSERAPAGIATLQDKYFPYVNMDSSYIIANGGSIVYGPYGQSISTASIRHDAVSVIEHVVKQYKDIDLYAYILEDEQYVMTHDDFVEKNGGIPRTCEFLTVKVLGRGVSITDYVEQNDLTVNILKAKSEAWDETYYHGFEEIDKLRKELFLYDDKLARHDLTFHRTSPSTIDVQSIHFGKKNAIEKVLNHLGYSRDQCLVISDGSDDHEMLQSCNTSISMGTLPTAMHRVATHMTDHIRRDGWTKAINKFVDIPYKTGKNGHLINLVLSDDICQAQSEELDQQLQVINVPHLKLYPFNNSLNDKIDRTFISWGGSKSVIDGEVHEQTKIFPEIYNHLIENVEGPTFLVSSLNEVFVLNHENVDDLILFRLADQMSVNAIKRRVDLQGDEHYIAIYTSNLPLEVPHGFEAVYTGDDQCTDINLYHIRQMSLKSFAASMIKKIGGSVESTMWYTYNSKGVYPIESFIDNGVLIVPEQQMSETVYTEDGDNEVEEDGIVTATSPAQAIHRYIGFQLMYEIYRPERALRDSGVIALDHSVPPTKALRGWNKSLGK